MNICECGCNTEIPELDKKGRPRRFVAGHHNRVKDYTNYNNEHIKKYSFKKGNIPWNKGVKLPVSADQRLHNKRVGFKKGCTPWNKGKHFMPKNIEQILEIGKKYRYKKGELAGSKHPNWKGGITPENNKIRTSKSMREWRKAVFNRDKYTCVLCGKVGGDLIADHIKGFSKYPNLRFDINNGRTLCVGCNHISTYKLREWAN